MLKPYQQSSYFDLGKLTWLFTPLSKHIMRAHHWLDFGPIHLAFFGKNFQLPKDILKILLLIIKLAKKFDF
jgi:hypothetical protein